MKLIDVEIHELRIYNHHLKNHQSSFLYDLKKYFLMIKKYFLLFDEIGGDGGIVFENETKLLMILSQSQAGCGFLSAPQTSIFAAVQNV